MEVNMKYFYIAIQINDNGKLYAFTMRTSEISNLWAQLSGIRNIYVASVCPTKKDAKYLVNYWNDAFRQNGTYLFSDEPLF